MDKITNDELMRVMCVDPISNEMLAKAMNEIFNVWWRKWRDRTDLEAADWDKIFEQQEYIILRYGNHILVLNIMLALIHELQARQDGKYCEMEMKK